jgi:hypothetical protein
LSSYFGDIVLVGRDSFSLIIYEIEKFRKKKLCFMCIDDSSLILFFFRIYFPSIIFSVKLVNENNYGLLLAH